MDLTLTDLLELYRWMTLSRLFEQACCSTNQRWFPAEGEEAAIVGSFWGLRPDDAIAPHYRGPFVAYAMRGAELPRLAAQALGKASGYARGRAVPFIGPVGVGTTPWVAGDLGTSLSVAAGVALGFWLDRQNPVADNDPRADRVVVCTFGDGTANRGDFHEALNLAAVWKLPIVYVCQNNHYAISLRLEKYLPVPVADRASGYGIPGTAVDGNDVVAVVEAVQTAVARARAGAGPSLIEARTYRLRGHWADDAATYRPADEVTAWQALDPLLLVEQTLLKKGVVTPALIEDVRRQVAAAVEEAFAVARSTPDAGPDDLGLNEVYARGE